MKTNLSKKARKSDVPVGGQQDGVIVEDGFHACSA
jgi:hypothetical protein